MFNLILSLTVYTVVLAAAVLILILIITEREFWALYRPLDSGEPYSGCLFQSCFIHKDKESEEFCLFMKSLKRSCS